jgi:hypothetical protein
MWGKSNESHTKMNDEHTLFYRSLNKDKYYCNLKHFNGNTNDYIYSRLERAAFDQRDENNVATFSRYAIWADDIRYLLMETMKALETQDLSTAKSELTLALNALGAFVDIQTMFHSLRNKMQFIDPKSILAEYKDFIEQNKD